ncbi:MAG: PQQ-binding-like beta-propeller repeat protein [Maribacter sp.]|nr:PQQ-binding-like beta-propeller repeat protein [Maribacter sp.]
MTRFLLLLFLLLLCLNQTFGQEIVWQFKTADRVYSSPALDGNMVFIGSGDHHLYAIDKTTGKEVWRYKTGGAVHSSPFIWNNFVCVGSNDGYLYAIEKSSGQLIWKFASEGEKMYDLWDYYLSSPTGNSDMLFWGSGDSNLYAIVAQTGDLAWKFTTGGIIHASPVVKENNLFIGSYDGQFYCLDVDKGSLNWKFKTIGATYFPKGEIQKAALVKDDVVYFGSRDYNIYALNAKTGIGMWNMRQPSGWIIATPMEYKNNIYFGTSDAHKFYALEKVNGTSQWTFPVQMRVYGSAIAYNDVIYFGTFDGKVIGVDYATGEKRWEYQTESSMANFSKIYNENGEFKEGFELYGKELLASEKAIHALGSILSTPIIADETIYFGSSDGNLYAVKL